MSRLLTRVAAFALAVAALTACSDEEILQGERFDVRAPLDAEAAEAAGDTAPVARAIRLPAPVARAEKPQLGGNSLHLPGHDALAPLPTLRWSADIGKGDTRRNRITATPVVAGGRIYAMDSQTQVTAVTTAGQTVWTRDLTPAGERSGDASGGGLAFGGGRLFVTTGFGRLVALDPATGAEIWTQRTDAPVSSAPTYRDGLVYIVSRDNRAWAIDAANGRVAWQLPGTPAPAGMIGGAAPAVSDRLAVFPFASAELVATLRKTGVRVWAASVAGQRRGRVYATLTDITADPVIAGDTTYTANQAGRAVAVKTSSGERLWTAEEGAYSSMLPVGGSVFLLSDEANLVRLDAGSGETVWSVDLPYFEREKPRRRKAIFAHHGPVLAGGRLWVASSDAALRAFSPESGALLAQVDLPGGASTRPVVAGGTLYVVSAKGQLLAFR